MPEAPEESLELTEEAPTADIEMGEAAETTEPAPDLASEETMAESAAAFSELANVARQLSSTPQETEAEPEPVSAQNAGNYTVDTLMRELLRPMLKEWLDAHLPSLVKWLVTEQIEKMLKDQLGIVPTPAAPAAEEAPAPVTEEPAVEETPPAEEPAAEKEPAAGDPTADMDFDAPAA